MTHEVKELRCINEEIEKKRFQNVVGSGVEKFKTYIKKVKIQVLDSITKQRQDILAHFEAVSQAASSYFDMSIGFVESSASAYSQLLRDIVQFSQSQDVKSFKASTQKKVDAFLRSFRLERRLINLMGNSEAMETKDKEETITLIQGLSEIIQKMNTIRKRLNKDSLPTKYSLLTERPIARSTSLNVANSGDSMGSTASSNSINRVSATMPLPVNHPQVLQTTKSNEIQTNNTLWLDKLKHKDLQLFNEYVFRKENKCEKPVGILINKKLTAQDQLPTTWKLKIKSIGNKGVAYLGIGLEDYFQSHSGQLTNKDYLNHRHYMITSNGKKYHSDRTADNNTLTDFSYNQQEIVKLTWLPKDKILQILNSRKKAELRGIMLQPGAVYRPCVYFDCESGTVKLMPDD